MPHNNCVTKGVIGRTEDSLDYLLKYISRISSDYERNLNHIYLRSFPFKFSTWKFKIKLDMYMQSVAQSHVDIFWTKMISLETQYELSTEFYDSIRYQIATEIFFRYNLLSVIF